VVIKIKSIFPTNENEKRLVQFIGRYQYISSKDTGYFFNDTYYPKRITRLVKNNILRRYQKYLVLGDDGYNFMKILGQHTVPLVYQKKYADRLKFMSHLAALYNNDKQITFTPSFEIKDKTAFTESSRKYIGILNIFGTNYLTYHISEEHTLKYINSIIYDLQKETKYKNIIILVNDISRIDFRAFAFGLNSVIICEDNDAKLQELKYLRQINWNKVIRNLYSEHIHLSEYNFCDYTDNRNKYITTFYFVDTEKINRIDTFLINNINKQADIICSKSIVKLLGKEIPTANYKLINLDEFIEKDIKIYD
jgi:hypothetical protein